MQRLGLDSAMEVAQLIPDHPKACYPNKATVLVQSQAEQDRQQPADICIHVRMGENIFSTRSNRLHKYHKLTPILTEMHAKQETADDSAAYCNVPFLLGAACMSYVHLLR